MGKYHRFGIACIVALAPLAAVAQPTPSDGRGVSWQPAVYAGTWTEARADRAPGAPVAGPMAALELRRRHPQRRTSFVATVSGYSKGSGRFNVDLPAPRREYRHRQDLLTLGLGADWAVMRTAADWTVGLSLAAVTSRITTHEITTTGVPFDRLADDEGWGNVSALVVVRSGATLPIAKQWGVRVGAEVLQGVESLNDVRPLIGAHIGLVLRR